MKKLFRKSMQVVTPASRPLDVPLPHAITSDALRVDIKPQFKVPLIPHPAPHHRLMVVASKQGLLLRPYTSGSTAPIKHVRVPWGRDADVQELDSHAEDSKELDWSSAAIVYGILGVVKLFTGMQAP